MFSKALSLSRDGTCVCVLSGDGSLGTRKSTPHSCHRHDWPADKMTKWFLCWSKKWPWVPNKPGLYGLVNTFSGHSMFFKRSQQFNHVRWRWQIQTLQPTMAYFWQSSALLSALKILWHMFEKVGDGQVMVKFWSWEGAEGDGMVINMKSCGQTSL